MRLTGISIANLLQARAYHAGQHYYVEVDIVMDEDTPLKVSHDVSQSLQRKLEGKQMSARRIQCLDHVDTIRSCRCGESLRACRLRERPRP